MKRHLIEFFKYRLSPSAWRVLKKAVNKILIFTWSDKYFYYDADYAKNALENTGWAEKFCREIRELFHPFSVVDFGCSVGVILSKFEKEGIDVLGIDGSAMSKKYSLISKKNFLLFDLRRRIDIRKKYDLCLCLEMAEHLEERYSDILVSSIVRSSSNIIFSAAPPDQVADCHFNLKPCEWWVKKFKKFNFEIDFGPMKIFRDRIKNIPKVPSYYIDNIMIFRESRHAK